MNAVNYKVLKQSMLLPKAVEYVERQNLNLVLLGITDYVWTCVRIKLTPTQLKSIQQMIGFGWQVVGFIRNIDNHLAAVLRDPLTLDLSVVYPSESPPQRHGRALTVLRKDWTKTMLKRKLPPVTRIPSAVDQFQAASGITPPTFWAD